MRQNVSERGFPADLADWVFTAFKSIDRDDSIYLGYKRIDDDVEISNAKFLELIHPGNAAIIFKVAVGNYDLPTGQRNMGHYTCAWVEDLGLGLGLAVRVWISYLFLLRQHRSVYYYLH